MAEVSRVARRGGLVRIDGVPAKNLKRAPRVEVTLAAIDTAVALGAAPVTYRLSSVALAA